MWSKCLWKTIFTCVFSCLLRGRKWKKPVRDVLGERGGEEKGKITGDEYDQSTPYMQIMLLNILLCIIDM